MFDPKEEKSQFVAGGKEVLRLDDKVKFLMELETLDNASPALISRCGLVSMVCRLLK